jgi:hypothetical protein
MHETYILTTSTAKQAALTADALASNWDGITFRATTQDHGMGRVTLVMEKGKVSERNISDIQQWALGFYTCLRRHSAI